MTSKFAPLLGLILAATVSTAAWAGETDLTESHKSGTYSGTQIVRISAVEGADIYFTTDGSTPDTSSQKYSGSPVIISENTLLKTAAYSDGKLLDRDSVNIKIRTQSPTSSVKSGSYSKAFSVKLTCADKTAEIRYTTDGSTPTRDSALYQKPLKITESCTLRFAAFGENLVSSAIVTRKYTIAGYSEPQRQELLELVNTTRAEYGLSPLETMDTLSDIAQQRAKECSTYFSHWRADGTKWTYLLQLNGLERQTRAENIAYYYPTARGAMNCWMNDYSHRVNILDPNAKYIGIGYYERGGVSYWTQIFLGDE